MEQMPPKRKVTYMQTGARKSVVLDLSRKAKLPGWRKSKNGNFYLETRKNRTDRRGSRL